MARKDFMFNENQNAWDSYYNNILDAWMEENQELDDNTFTEKYNKKKISVLQYKPVALAFEQYIQKSFDRVTADDIESFAEHTDKKSKLSHLNAFLLACVSNGYIVNSDTEFLISLLPKEYKIIGRMIANV